MSHSQLFAIVLAAGSSSRFGATKQLQAFRGAPLACAAVRLAEQVCGERSILVVGHEWHKVADACRPLRGFMVNNTRYRSGVASSIRSGVRAVAHTAGAILLLLADQPLVTPQHLTSLIRLSQNATGDIAASRYAGTLGPPIIFPARLFEALSALTGDRGARSLVAAEPDRLRVVDFEAGAVDIDRPADLAALEADVGRQPD